MKFSHVYQAVHHSPWLITPAGHATVVALLDKKIKQRELKASEDDDIETDFFGEPLPTMTIDPLSGLATIPVQGVMARGIGRMEKMCGGCDTNDVIANIQEAEASPFVKAILMEYNTPGGTVDGTAELGAAIAAIKKPNAAWVISQCASAGYWAASQNGRIFAALSSETGSIGVLSGSYDLSVMRKLGMEPDISITRPTAAPLKAPGAYGTPLTPAQQDRRQSQTDYLHSLFMNAVTSKRSGVRPEAMQGQTFFGQQAVDAGLVDEICTRDYAIASLL